MPEGNAPTRPRFGGPGRPVLFVTLAGLALGVLGPFGSFLNGGLAERCAYWVASVWCGSLLFGGAVRITRQVGGVRAWRRRALLTCILPLAAMLETVATRCLAFLLWPSLRLYDPGWWSWFGQTLSIGVMSVWLVVFLRRTRQEAGMKIGRGLTVVPPRHRPPATPAGPLRDVIALQMEDHYVRVHGPGGSTLLHMTLGEAIARVPAGSGLRTHRSWWVAREAVQRVDGPPRAMRLVLRNGVVAPVARSTVSVLCEAGWLTAADDVAAVVSPGGAGRAGVPRDGLDG